MHVRHVTEALVDLRMRFNYYASIGSVVLIIGEPIS